MQEEDLNKIEQLIHNYIEQHIASGKSILQISTISIMSEITLKARETHSNFELNIDSFKLGMYYGAEICAQRIVETQKEE